MTIESPGSRPVTALVGDLLRDSRELVRTEVQLIRAELSEKVTQMQTAGMALLVAAICILVSLVVLSQALVVALAEIMEPAWAALLVGLVFAAIAALLFLKARANLKPSNLAPDRTADQLNKDKRMVKEHLS